MIFHYGPATWFITLSPGEWVWEDLVGNLHEMNPEMNDLTICTVVTADPVLASRFIANKFKAVLDFLLFNKVSAHKRLLHNVVHYCVRLQYQGTGTTIFLITIMDTRCSTDGFNNN